MPSLKYLPQALAFVLLLLLALGGSPIPPALRLLAALGVIALLTLYRWQVAIEIIARWWPLMLVPLVAIASALWSSEPQASVRYGVQWLISIYAGILLARSTNPRDLIVATAGALFVYCILCLLDGTRGSSQNGWVIVGYSGSKNSMASFAMLLLLSAQAMLLMGKLGLTARLLAVASLPLAVFFIVQSHSAGALVLSIVASGMLFVFWFAERLTPSLRLAALVSMLIVSAPLALLTPEAIDAYNTFVFDTLGKDPTLSGRAELWAHADSLIAQKPWLGHGYRAVWMGDGIESETLQRLSGRADLRTFNFHDHFRQIRVDLGYLGLAAFLATTLVPIAAAVLVFIARPTIPVSFFAVFMLTTVSRASFESLPGGVSSAGLILFAASAIVVQEALSLRAGKNLRLHLPVLRASTH